MARTVISLAIALLISPFIASADTINGCVKQNNGKLRLVADLGQCKSNEAPVSWESEGPPGPAGPQGPQGDAAPAPPKFEFVGFTIATFLGNEGVLGYSAACEVEFPDSRMCTSAEVFQTSPVPALVGEGWVLPSLDNIIESIGAASARTLSCSGWRKGGSETGLRITEGGKLEQEDCAVPGSVACCAPVP